MKKWYFITLTMIVGLFLASCSSNNKTSQKISEASSSQVKSVDKSSTTSGDKKDTNSSTAASNEGQSKGTMRVGSDEYGYIDIPETWLPFTDVDGGDSIQYTDGSGYNIVTLSSYTKEKSNVPTGEEFTAELIANRIAAVWKQNADAERSWGAKTTVAGNEAFQVNVILKSGQYLTVWIFKHGERVYFVSVEGSEATLLQFVNYVEKTWSLDKNSSKHHT